MWLFITLRTKAWSSSNSTGIKNLIKICSRCLGAFIESVRELIFARQLRHRSKSSKDEYLKIVSFRLNQLQVKKIFSKAYYLSRFLRYSRFPKKFEWKFQFKNIKCFFLSWDKLYFNLIEILNNYEILIECLLFSIWNFIWIDNS